MMVEVSVYLFFFQAEDGIRDRNVTGVQTCALPICFSPVNLGPPYWGFSLGHLAKNANSRLFRINGLAVNCWRVIDKYGSYSYPCLPVGVRWHYFRRLFAFFISAA